MAPCVEASRAAHATPRAATSEKSVEARIELSCGVSRVVSVMVARYREVWFRATPGGVGTITTRVGGDYPGGWYAVRGRWRRLRSEGGPATPSRPTRLEPRR